MDTKNNINIETENVNNTNIKVNKDEPTLYLILGIIQIILCSFTTGLITIILSFIAKQDLAANNLTEYRYKIRACRVATIFGFIIGAIIFVAIVFSIILSFILIGANV